MSCTQRVVVTPGLTPSPRGRFVAMQWAHFVEWILLSSEDEVLFHFVSPFPPTLFWTLMHQYCNQGNQRPTR